MKTKKSHITLIILIIGLISCLGIKSIEKTEYIGGFQEHEYDFFESFQHTTDVDFYYNLPFDLKFGGLIRQEDYSWLRNSKNLVIAFNTIKSIGLNKFVSYEQYNKLNSDWCCDTQWENKSLNQIVIEFINADTTGNDYYSKFWKRRKKEGNLTETYQIFTQIDDFYNGIDKGTGKTNDILENLLDFDLQLVHADSIDYQKIVMQYFNYLKSVQLDYSAYKLTFHNKKYYVRNEIKDSLLMTIKHDTLSRENWNKLNDNYNGWITGEFLYPDPNMYYGP